VAAEQALFDRMGVARGDLVRLGNATFRLMGVLEK
jgi:predicted lysophospholipase L1 biosynthesis ABC-type transport system permease subunit